MRKMRLRLKTRLRKIILIEGEILPHPERSRRMVSRISDLRLRIADCGLTNPKSKIQNPNSLRLRFNFLLSLSLSLSLSLPLFAQEPDLGTEAQREAGKQLYMQKCAQCHGEKGDGNGISEPFLRPAPRDFTSGIFKFRSTASGELPSDADLKRSIREGMPYTGMPAWSDLTDAEVTNLVYFIKTFNDYFSGPYGVVKPIEIPNPPSFNEESAKQGRQVYLDNQCFDCHGNLGRGNGKSAPTLKDQWGHPIRPADLTKRWTFRNGKTRQDIFRTFTTGLDGSPMPSYSIKSENQWALVDYVYSLSRDTPNYATMAVAHPVQEEIDLNQGRALFGEGEGALFPVVGQVIEPGRAFYPGVNAIDVKAIYNADEIAIMLSWHDMSAEKTGTNSPSLEVPKFDVEMLKSDSVYTGKFSDAVAIQFPSKMPEGQKKPYFLFGDKTNAVDIWFADLSKNNAEYYIGRGYKNIESGKEEIGFTSNYQEGEWTVIFKKKRISENGLSFNEYQFIPITFSVWDGFNNERGNKRGITDWYYLYVEPMESKSAAIPMAKYGIIALLVELALIWYIRRKYRQHEIHAVAEKT